MTFDMCYVVLCRQR